MICGGRCHHCTHTHGWFIHSLCHSLPRSHCGLSQCCLFGVWLILQPLSYLFSLSLGNLDLSACPCWRYELWDMAHGYRHGYGLTYFLLFIPASTSLTFVFPSSSGSHMHALHIISNERCLCKTEGKRPYMECRSLQCLEREKRWLAEGGDEEYERDCLTNWQQKRGIQMNKHFVLICNTKMQLLHMSNFLHTNVGSLSLLFLCYAIVSSGLWMWIVWEMLLLKKKQLLFFFISSSIPLDVELMTLPFHSDTFFHLPLQFDLWINTVTRRMVKK